MDGAGRQLFAGARFAADQDGGVGGGDFGNEGADIGDSVTDTHQATIKVFKVALRCRVSGRHLRVALPR